MKLCQAISVYHSVKRNVETSLAEAKHYFAVPSLLSGMVRDYQPRDDDGDKLPSESQPVQIKITEVLAKLQQTLCRLYDVTATREYGNTIAKADVIVEGGEEPLLKNVPVNGLLFLEKQLGDLLALVQRMPTLDPSKTWTYDPAASCYRSEPVKTIRTVKQLQNHVKYPHTKEHPAQTETYWADVPAGDWTTVYLSGAMPADEVELLTSRLVKLLEAVKMAREGANTVEVTPQRYGQPLLDYVFSPARPPAMRE